MHLSACNWSTPRVQKPKRDNTNAPDQFCDLAMCLKVRTTSGVFHYSRRGLLPLENFNRMTLRRRSGGSLIGEECNFKQTHHLTPADSQFCSKSFFIFSLSLIFFHSSFAHFCSFAVAVIPADSLKQTIEEKYSLGRPELRGISSEKYSPQTLPMIFTLSISSRTSRMTNYWRQVAPLASEMTRKPIHTLPKFGDSKLWMTTASNTGLKSISLPFCIVHL